VTGMPKEKLANLRGMRRDSFDLDAASDCAPLKGSILCEEASRLIALQGFTEAGTKLEQAQARLEIAAVAAGMERVRKLLAEVNEGKEKERRIQARLPWTDFALDFGRSDPFVSLPIAGTSLQSQCPV
jgi:hypothetical protein